MKTCTTCGMQAEERASFCPCCGTSFITQPLVPPAPTTPPAEVKPQSVAPSPAAFEDKKKKGGHALPIVIISVLTALTVTLATLWLSGSLASMLGKDGGNNNTATDKNGTSTNDDEKPSVIFNSLPQTAATYGDGQVITTGQYLAYLYLEFENLYYNQGLYQYASYGIDPWTQEFPYGDGGEKLILSDYIIRATQDNIKRQIVLQQMLKDNGLKWFAEDEAELNKTLSTLEKDAYINMGFNNTSYAYALKNANLNERSAFFGLYGEGGARAVSELDLRRYFVSNYLSYKMISIPLTDNNGKALASDSLAYKWFVERMAVYQTVCQQQGFEAAYALYEKDQPTIQSLKSENINVSLHTIVTLPTTGATAPSTNDEHDHQHRQDVDSTYMDENMVQAIRTVDVNDTAIVNYKAGGTTPAIALVERLDIYSDASVYENAIENIIYEMRYDAFDQEVKDAMNALVITFDQKVATTAKPEDFLLIIDNT